MATKTWFLPPDFNLLPDGELALGTIIKHPTRATLSLASLGDHPDINLPPVKSLVESDHKHSADDDLELQANFFAQVVRFFTASGRLERSRSQKRNLSPGDLEVRSYSGKFSNASLKSITEIDEVKTYRNGSGWRGKNYVYIITGLLVTKDSFVVSNEAQSSTSGSLEASGDASSSGVSAKGGAGASGKAGNDVSHSHGTAPGVIYAYRLHVIRPKGETELFSSKDAFFSGGDFGDEEQEEMEFAAASPIVVKQDLAERSQFTEHKVGEDVVFVDFTS
ncbi:hypothetical protein QQS21_012942 [Conoideocrella luteorostrata]|uniref:Uncharacterized protein n=1 Tax=Conoideocrella luteorostrata TaxID=1105319 RepID=A0AAJ0CBD9_9HYPO|nr:hypothetical protein QQS21_012942 [Conoideocrella luteorostrata]